MTALVVCYFSYSTEVIFCVFNSTFKEFMNKCIVNICRFHYPYLYFQIDYDGNPTVFLRC